MKIYDTSLDIYDGCHMLVIEDVFVFFECELPNEKISKSKELALMRIVDTLSSTGKLAVFFISRPNELDFDKEVINGSQSIVKKIYCNNQWYKGNGCTLKEMTDRFINWAEAISPER